MRWNSNNSSWKFIQIPIHIIYYYYYYLYLPFEDGFDAEAEEFFPCSTLNVVRGTIRDSIK